MTKDHSYVPKLCSGGDISPKSSEVVLVVEDDSSLRRMVCAQLRSFGYSVLEAEDGQAALEALDSDSRVDLLLTDIVLSGDLSGVDLGHVARELRTDLKLMYMSAYPAGAAEAGTPFERGVILLRKPFRRSEIATAVKKALNAS